MLEAIATVTPEGPIGGPLALQRAWPRSPDHALLEYRDTDGDLVAGQWIRDPAVLADVAEATRRRAPLAPVATVAVGSGGAETARGAGGVLLQAAGADRKLRGLSGLVRAPGATLVAHRPERRGVVRHDGLTAARYAKVVRPEKLPGLVATSAFVAAVADGASGAFAVPALLVADEAAGVATFAALPGRSLHDRLDAPGLDDHCAAAGRALRALHAAPPPPGTAHDADAEARLLDAMIGRAEAFATGLPAGVRTAFHRVRAALAETPGPAALLHRDFYDKQIVVSADGAVGLLDFDTLAAGEAALDVANMIAHLELRAMQRRCAEADAVAAARAFLDAYDVAPETRRRLPAWLAASRLRLACVYACRPPWADVPDRLVDRLVAGGAIDEALA